MNGMKEVYRLSKKANRIVYIAATLVIILSVVFSVSSLTSAMTFETSASEDPAQESAEDVTVESKINVVEKQIAENRETSDETEAERIDFTNKKNTSDEEDKKAAAGKEAEDAVDDQTDEMTSDYAEDWDTTAEDNSSVEAENDWYQEETVQEEYVPSRNYYSDVDYAGNLVIPAIGCDVNVYYSYDDFYLGQMICNRTDSAFADGYVTSGVSVIGDHSYESFNGLWNCGEGTYAYFTCPDGTVLTLYCFRAYAGYNNDAYGFADNNGVPLTNYQDIIMYTCLNATGESIWVTHWCIL